MAKTLEQIASLTAEDIEKMTDEEAEKLLQELGITAAKEPWKNLWDWIAKRDGFGNA